MCSSGTDIVNLVVINKLLKIAVKQPFSVLIVLLRTARITAKAVISTRSMFYEHFGLQCVPAVCFDVNFWLHPKMNVVYDDAKEKEE